MDFIQLSHGSGGEETNKLIEELFFKYLGNEFLLQKNDATTLGKISGEIAMTTDSFVVDPIFFNGGNIGKLSICGTVNDLSVVGAIPLYLSLSNNSIALFLASLYFGVINSTGKVFPFIFSVFFSPKLYVFFSSTFFVLAVAIF